ncbi:uncharacterized protein ACIQIH_000395 [Cyanocitta cristata]
MAAQPEVASASTQDGGKTGSVSRYADTGCGVSGAGGRREHSGSRIDRVGSSVAAILRRSHRHIGVVPVISALLRPQRQWRGVRGAALPGREHRGGCSGLGAKNIQNCHLPLTDSRNVLHSSCFGMGMAVGSSGRTSTQRQQRESWRRRWKTLSLGWWNSWEMESSRSSKNRVGSRLQPVPPGGSVLLEVQRRSVPEYVWVRRWGLGETLDMKFQGCSPCWSEKQWKQFAVCFFIPFTSSPSPRSPKAPGRKAHSQVSSPGSVTRTGTTTELDPSLGPRALVLEQPKPAWAPLVLPMVWMSDRLLFSSVLG